MGNGSGSWLRFSEHMIARASVAVNGGQRRRCVKSASWRQGHTAVGVRVLVLTRWKDSAVFRSSVASAFASIRANHESVASRCLAKCGRDLTALNPATTPGRSTDASQRLAPQNPRVCRWSATSSPAPRSVREPAGRDGLHPRCMCRCKYRSATLVPEFLGGLPFRMRMSSGVSRCLARCGRDLTALNPATTPGRSTDATQRSGLDALRALPLVGGDLLPSR